MVIYLRHELISLFTAKAKSITYKFDVKDEKSFLELLTMHGLVGYFYETIDPNSFKEPKYLLKFKQIFQSYISKDVKQQEVIKNLESIFTKEEIPFIFLKGVPLKKIYPNTYERTMGDIDILVKKDDFLKAKEVLEKNNYKYLSATTHHHVYESSSLMEVELHQSITSIVDYDSKGLLDDCWSYVTEKEGIPSFDPSFEYVYLLTHFARHIKTSGVGLRNLIDLEIYLIHHLKDMDQKRLEILLNRVGLQTMHERLLSLLDVLYREKPMTDKDGMVLDYIIKSGVHGLGKEHNYYESKKTYETKKLKKSKFRYFLSEVFPRRTYIMEQYPYLKKYPILLTYAWFVRILKQVFRKPKDTKMRLKAITNDKKTSDIENVYNTLGL